jgi:hypothetical protein
VRAGWLPVAAGPVATLAAWLLISVTSSDVAVAATDTIVVLLIWAAVARDPEAVRPRPAKARSSVQNVE